jgi:hypothetical protein
MTKTRSTRQNANNINQHDAGAGGVQGILTKQSSTQNSRGQSREVSQRHSITHKNAHSQPVKQNVRFEEGNGNPNGNTKHDLFGKMENGGWDVTRNGNTKGKARNLNPNSNLSLSINDMGLSFDI